jgi:predicted Zn-dependent protease with MMP-like domain
MEMVLFHVIADPACAEVRKQIVAWKLKDEIDFRNIDTSPAARAELEKSLGRIEVPALQTEGAWVVGGRDVLDYLSTLAHDPAFVLYPRFDELAAEVWRDVMALLPLDLRPVISRIQFLIEDEISEELKSELSDSVDPSSEEVCGLHVGVPITHDSVMTPSWEPPRVYLFRFAILNLLEPVDDNAEIHLKYEIAVTLLHEMGHHFGLSELDLDRLGYS